MNPKKNNLDQIVLDENRLIAGKYSVYRLIAETYLSKIYKGINHETDETIIIKVPNMHSLSKITEKYRREELEGLFVQVIHNENLLLKSLDHSGIPKSYGIHYEPISHGIKLPVLIMEYVPSHLEAFFRDRPFLQRLAEFTIQTAEILEYLHKKGIVHGDIKPTNIMCFRDEIKLIDFNVSSNKENKLSLMVKGKRITINFPKGFHSMTDAYAAPEVCNLRTSVFASDIYSFGRIMEDLILADATKNYSAFKKIPSKKPKSENIHSSTLPQWMIKENTKTNSIKNEERQSIFSNDEERQIIYSALKRFPSSLLEIYAKCKHPSLEKRLTASELRIEAKRLLKDSKKSYYRLL